MEKVGVPKGKTSYVPPPINTEHFRPLTDKHVSYLRHRYELPADSKIILYTGQVEYLRGTFTLVEAFKELVKGRSSIKLVICHPEVRYERVFMQRLVKLIKELDLRESIVMLGRQLNMNEIYNIADCIALPFTGPYLITDPPLTLLEAMSAGRVVVTTPVGSLREFLVDGYNALLANPGDVTGLSYALQRALSLGS
ncbi:glycosyltransferase family 4 protein, partial [Candidatus Bathyarchaeota archaeon]|nr:glycosyltransferase family 4 protein [Candidatus Bathyarchaeota archaeon]